MPAQQAGGGPVQAGRYDTRRDILELLRRHGRLSAPQLAGQLGISAVGIRRHLLTLERDGLVSAQTERAAKGRPAARYALTDQGRQTFPRHYDELAQAALSFLGAEGGRALHDFLAWRNERLAAEYGPRLRSGTVEGRARELADALTEQGFMAEVEDSSDGLKLCQHNCTVEHIAAEHPDVCAWEAALFQRLLGAAVTRESTIVDGSVRCVTHVGTPSTDSAAQEPPAGRVRRQPPRPPDSHRQYAERARGTDPPPDPRETATRQEGESRAGGAGGHAAGAVNDDLAAPREGARRPARSDA